VRWGGYNTMNLLFMEFFCSLMIAAAAALVLYNVADIPIALVLIAAAIAGGIGILVIRYIRSIN
jgi:hypothetical protein